MQTVQFVENMTASSARLNLHGGRWSVKQESTLPPPELRRAVSGSLLQDGETVPAEAYGNRLLTLKMEVATGSVDDTAGEMQKLFRELDRPRNMIKYQPHTSTPVWFRTFRAGPLQVDVINEGRSQFVTAEIVAEPFAYGAKHVVASSLTINMDPANGTNGMFLDITGVRGDVEVPAQVSFPGAQIPGFTSAVAVRRRGTPSNTPFVQQAEAMTQGTDTTTQPNDATMSGAGNNFSRCTFTTATMQTRLSTSVFPASQSVDARGMYRVFARTRRSSATGPINVQLNSNAAVATPLSTNIQMIELGEVVVPGGMDPIMDGPSGSELMASGAGLTVKAERTSGTSTLDFDYFLFFPADNYSDRFALVTWPSAGSGTHVFDGYNGMVYNADASTGAVLNSSASYQGLTMMLTPNQTNRLFFARKATGLADAVTDGVTCTVAYWPRHLSVAPVP